MGGISTKTMDEYGKKKAKRPPVGMAHGGEVCPACGCAMGGEADDDDAVPSNLDETASDPAEERKRYISAIKGNPK